MAIRWRGERWTIGAALAVMILAAGVAVWWRTSGDGDDASRAPTTTTAPMGTTTTAGTTTPPSTAAPMGTTTTAVTITPPSTSVAPTTTATVPATTSPAGTTTAPTAPTAPTTPTGPTTPSAPGRLIWSGPADARLVTLTFDAGSDVGNAAAILDTLAANGITATFGITGRFADDNPGVVGDIAGRGHQLVNHSYGHPSFTGYSTGDPPVDTAGRVDELWRAEAAIVAAAGRGTLGWFRPPYGDVDDGVVADVAAAGWPLVLMWTVDSLGWQGIGADAVVERCLERAAPGAILLFHVGSASDDAAALQRIIDGLRAQGYGFATAAELAG